MTLHILSFARNQYSGLYSASCSCGWTHEPGPKLQVETQAGIHDLNQDNPDFQTGLEFSPDVQRR